MTTPNITIPSLSSKVSPEVKRAFQSLVLHLQQVSTTADTIAAQGLITELSLQETLDNSGYFAPDLTIPAAPTGFIATGLFNKILLEWNAVPGRHVGYYEIFRNSADNLGEAVKVGTTYAVIFTDTPPDSSLSATYYYWVRAVNKWDASIVGPFNATAGTPASTADDPTYVLQLLTARISESHLLASLNDRIDLIDLPGTGLVDKAAALQTQLDEDVATLQAAVDQAEAALQAQVDQAVADLALLEQAEAALQAQVDADVAALQGQLAQAQAALEGQLDQAETSLQTQIGQARELADSRILEARERARLASETLGDATLELLLRAQEARERVDGRALEFETFRDAIATVDPETGEIVLYAVDSVREEIDARDGEVQSRFSEVEIALSAQQASILLKADQITVDAHETRLTEAEIDIDGANATITQHATDISLIDGRVTAAESSIVQHADAITLRATKTELNQAVSDILAGFEPAVSYQFNGTVEGWTATNATLTANTSTVTLTGTAAGPSMQHASLSIDGDANALVFVRLRRLAGSGWVGKLRYATSGHGYSDSYYKDIPEPDLDNFYTIQVSMRDLTAGGTDWEDSTITGVQLLLGADGADSFEIDSIEIGKSQIQNLLFSDLEGRLGQAEVDIDATEAAITLKASQLEVDALSASLSQAEIDIDGAEAAIALKASQTSLEAVEGDLDTLTTRVSQAEIDIDGAEASILLKADLTTVDAQEVRLSQAELDIDGAQAAITLKADQTALEAESARISQAELDIDAANTRIAGTVSSVTLVRGQTDAQAEATLESLLAHEEGWDTARESKARIAVAELSIRAISDEVSAEASSRLELAALVDGALADLVEERLVRAGADAAEASARSLLAVRVTDAEAGIVAEQTARASADEALASDVTALDTRLTDAESGVGGNASAITSLDARVTNAEGTITSQSSDITLLQSSVTTAQDAADANATALSSLTTRVTSAEGSITSQASDISALDTRVTNAENDVAGNASAINGLDARVTANEGTITSQSSQITSLESGLSTAQNDVDANASAISGLSTRVTSAEGSITSQATDIAALQADVGDNEAAILTEQAARADADSAIASDVMTLEAVSETQGEAALESLLDQDAGRDAARLASARAASVEQDVQAVASDITALDARLTSAEGGASGNASAITALEVRVTSTEGRVTSQSSQITSLQAAASDAQNNIEGNSEAISGLDTRVTAAEGEIASQASDITSLESSVSTAQTTADGAVTDAATAQDAANVNASAISGLTTRVTANEGELTSQASDITSLDTRLTSAESGVGSNATAISGLDTRMTSAEGSLTSQSSQITTLQSSVSTAQTTANGAVSDAATAQDAADAAATDAAAAQDAADGNALAINSLDTRVTNAEGTITSQASQITGLKSDVGDNAAAILAEATTRADADGAIAGDVSTLQAVVDDAETGLAAAHAAVQTEATARADADGTLGAEYAIKVNANGHVAGMGVAISGGESGPIESEIIMLADRFAIVKPTADAAEALTVPFVVGNVGGVPKVVMSEALIGDATIGRAAIKDLAVDDAKIADLSGDKIKANTITASKYNELRNSLIFNGGDSLDSSHPLEVPFLLLNELTAIQSVRLSFKIMPYRGYSTGAASGGGASQTSTQVAVPTHHHHLKVLYSSAGPHALYQNGGGTLYAYRSDGPTSGNTTITLTAADGHTHTVPAYYTRSTSGLQRLYMYSDTETIGGGSNASVALSMTDSHAHNLCLNAAGATGAPVCLDNNGNLYANLSPAGQYHNAQPTGESPGKHTHSVTIPSHAHDIEFGIYEEDNSPSITVNTDNGTGYGTALGYSSDQYNIDLTGRFYGAGWKMLKFTASARCRISYVLECKLDITA